MAIEFRRRNKEKEREEGDGDKGKDTKEIATIITSIVMGEGGHGYTFTNDELVLIGSVYINLLRAEGHLNRLCILIEGKTIHLGYTIECICIC